MTASTSFHAGVVVIAPAAAAAVQRYRDLIRTELRRDGLTMPPLAVEFFDAIDVCAALYRPGLTCPPGPIGRPQNDAERILLTTQETAQRIPCSERHVRRLITQQRCLPAVRISGRLMVDPADLEQYLAARDKKSGPAREGSKA